MQTNKDHAVELATSHPPTRRYLLQASETKPA
jgi:hypothetical protein